MDTQSTSGPGTRPGRTRRLTRATDRKIIAGVAAGLADYFGIDPVWFRLGFVVSALFGGVGVLAYLVLWLIVPADTDPAVGPTPVERHAERIARSMRATPAWVGVALLALGALLVAVQVLEWEPDVFWGIALIVLGVLLFRQRDEATPETAPSATRAADVSAPTPPPYAGSLAPPAPPLSPSPPPVPTAAAPSPPPRREPSRLGWITIGTLLVAIGAVTLLDYGDVIDVSLAQYLALAMTVLGIGLLTGARWGRARWLIVPGLLLVPFLMAASLVEVPFVGGVGNRVYRPASIADIQSAYRLVAGEMVVDLRDASLGAAPVEIEATVVAGRILVIVPEGTPLQVRARAGAGQVSLFGQHQDGLRVDVRRTFGAADAAGVVRLDLEAALGQVEVSTVETSRPFRGWRR